MCYVSKAVQDADTVNPRFTELSRDRETLYDRGFVKSELFKMGWKTKKSYFSIALFKRNYPSSPTYKGVKNVSIFICCSCDCSVFS